MQFRLLGPLEVRASDNRLVRLGAEKHRILLSALLLSANQWVSAERLVDALWSHRPPPSAPSALRTYVSALRSLLLLTSPASATRITAGPGGYQLRLACADLDVLVFSEQVGRGQKALANGDLATAAQALQRAEGLWRGCVLEDVPHGPGVTVEVGRLEELRRSALESLVEAQLGLGQHTDVVTELGGVVSANPLRERLRGLWMLALYRSGRQVEALASFRQLRTQLVRELGIEPGPPLQRLQRQILSADPALDSPTIAPRAVPVVPRQLPPDVARFTGREPELARLDRLLRPGRAYAPVIAAIDGAPGVGKSALAIRAAHRVADRFPDGHLYTDLHGDPGSTLSVLRSFLRALGSSDRDLTTIDEAAGRYRAVTATRRILVVLDNVLTAAQIQSLVPAAPGCAVLVTSRRVLATLDGAAALHLDVLPAPQSVALLSGLAGPERIAADPAAAAEVAGLCGYLPLALRIAGARLAARPSWPVGALRDRLRGAPRRLDELQLGELGVRTSFQVSLHALRDSPAPEDRLAARAFALVALLADTDVPAAAALLDEPATMAEAALERLVDVQLMDNPAPGRYELRELVRLFAQECAVDELSAAERRAATVRALLWYDRARSQPLRLVPPGLLDGALP